MREKKFTRIAAFLLYLTMLLGNAVIFASASDAEGSGGSITDVSLEEPRELLNAISYEEYSDKNATVPGATQTVEVPINLFSTQLSKPVISALANLVKKFQQTQCCRFFRLIVSHKMEQPPSNFALRKLNL